MRGNTGLAAAKYGQLAGDAANGGTTAARRPLVAGHIRIVKILAARALQQIAGGRGAVPDLSGGAGQDGARQHAVVLPDSRIRGQVRPIRSHR
ncbi:hypothetical protein G6F60_015320 [Rhizopus arrhizus]|nr:hypothetical protein G6F60_015320 [Rhizopus arrhizus]